MSKKALKKQQKEAEKAAKKAQRQQEREDKENVRELAWLFLLINTANSCDPDLDWQNVGPDLDPSRLTLWLCSWKVKFEKNISRRQQEMKKITQLAELMTPLIMTT